MARKSHLSVQHDALGAKMILEGNSNTKLQINSVEKLMLPFQPVCDLCHDVELPYIPGVRIHELDFSNSSSDPKNMEKSA